MRFSRNIQDFVPERALMLMCINFYRTMIENHVVDLRHACHETAIFKGYFRHDAMKVLYVRDISQKFIMVLFFNLTCLARTADHEFDNML